MSDNQQLKLIGMRGVTEFPAYKQNPYMNSLIVPSKNKTIAMSNRQLSLFDPSTGEVEQQGITFLGVRKRVDTEEFVKIYKSQIQSLFDLSNRALRVFGYCLDASRLSKDQIFFHLDECKKYTGYTSKNTIITGVAELLEKEFLARTPAFNVYFINPAKFFNGDRLVLFQDIIRKGSTLDNQLEEREQEQGIDKTFLAPE
jgi:hypothetical protein